MNDTTATVDKSEFLEHYIIWLRNAKVMLDRHLATLYGVETRTLIQAVKRNIERFPDDFMFQLTKEEQEILRSQNVISRSTVHGGRRYPPYAFTEQGVAMLSTVLRSERAVKVNIEIMRAFVKLRKMLESNKQLKQQLDQLEQKYDEQFQVVFKAIRQLMTPPSLPPPKTTKKYPIGFKPWTDDQKIQD